MTREAGRDMARPMRRGVRREGASFYGAGRSPAAGVSRCRARTALWVGANRVDEGRGRRGFYSFCGMIVMTNGGRGDRLFTLLFARLPGERYSPWAWNGLTPVS